MESVNLLQGLHAAGRVLGWVGGLYGVALTAYVAFTPNIGQNAAAYGFLAACVLGYALALWLMRTKQRAPLGALVLVLVVMNLVSLPSIGFALLPGTVLLGVAAVLW